MHLHLVKAVTPVKGPRPAKVVSLEVRRLESAQPKLPPKSAA